MECDDVDVMDLDVDGGDEYEEEDWYDWAEPPHASIFPSESETRDAVPLPEFDDPIEYSQAKTVAIALRRQPEDENMAPEDRVDMAVSYLRVACPENTAAEFKAAYSDGFQTIKRSVRPAAHFSTFRLSHALARELRHARVELLAPLLPWRMDLGRFGNALVTFADDDVVPILAAHIRWLVAHTTYRRLVEENYAEQYRDGFMQAMFAKGGDFLRDRSRNPYTTGSKHGYMAYLRSYVKGCHSRLADAIVDWEEALQDLRKEIPDSDWEARVADFMTTRPELTPDVGLLERDLDLASPVCTPYSKEAWDHWFPPRVQAILNDCSLGQPPSPDVTYLYAFDFTMLLGEWVLLDPV